MSKQLVTQLLPPDLAAKIKYVTEIETGYHTTYRCELIHGELWFLKLALTDDESLLFEADITSALNKINRPLPLTANLVWVAPDGQSLLTSGVNGQPLTPATMVEQFQNAVGALHKLHQIELPNISIPSWRHQDLKALIESQPEAFKIKWSLWERFLKLDGIAEKGIEFPGFIHGDLNQGNILYDQPNDTWALIDWESAQTSDVRWDLASIAVEFEFDDRQTTLLFAEYAEKMGVDKATFLAGAKSWIQFYKLTCLCWALTHKHPISRYL